MDDTISLSLKLGLGIAVVSIALYEIFAVQFTHLFMPDPATVGWPRSSFEFGCWQHR